MKIHCGCSGYQYDEWKGDFYPEDLPKGEWLSYYADTFETVEINGTFYGLPEKDTVRNWGEATPEDFQFALKGSQYITHQKKLKHDDKLEEAIENFFEAIKPLQEKTSCILWQLPGNLHIDKEKIRDFFALLPQDYAHAMEFRHESWFSEEVYQILADHHVACCAISTPEDSLPEDIQNTADLVYVRLHGKSEWYDHNYSEQELKSWLDKIKEAGAERAYVYFDNTAHGHAVENCRQFQGML